MSVFCALLAPSRSLRSQSRAKSLRRLYPAPKPGATFSRPLRGLGWGMCKV